VEHWPIKTVHEVRGLISPVPGFGFFWGQRFRLDGRKVHLYGLENSIIRKEFGDARIHAAINCASGSCPQLSSEPYLPETLDAQLDAAARRFAKPPHVRIDAGRKTVELSMIFKWFKDDFVSDARRLQLGTGVLDWIAHYAPEASRTQLDAARKGQFEIEYVEYDWTLNGE
ncbi:MAG: DUF547 domain-containing protein, partial [Planctomycetota bacterium]